MFGRLSHDYYNRGLIKAKEGMISAAFEDLWKSFNCDINNKEAWKLAGLCCYRLGRFAAAESCWKWCLYCGGADASVEELINDVRMIVEKIKPNIGKVFVLSSRKKYKKASVIFRKRVLPDLSRHSDAYKYLGILYMLSGNKRRALKEWKKALQIDSSDSTTTKYIAYAGYTPVKNANT